jgi:hypothetical protein
VITQTDIDTPAFSDEILEEFRHLVDANIKEAAPYDRALTLDDHSDSDLLKDQKVSANGNVLITSQVDRQYSGPGFLHSKRDITISGNVRLDSGLILVAEGKINVGGEAQIRDCILYSRTALNFRDQSFFQGQAISDGELSVKDHVQIRHPSLLCVKGKIVGKQIEGKLTLETESQAEGILMYYDEYLGKLLEFISENSGIVSIADGSQLEGIVLSTNRTNQEGTVLGNITTNTFFFSYPPTDHINWLRNSVTDRTRLKRNTVLPIVFEGSPRLEIAEYRVID